MGTRCAGFGIDDLHFGVGQRGADGGDAQFHRVVDARHGDHRRGFGLAVGDGHLVAVHALGDRAHDFDRAGRAGHDAGAQAGEIEAVEIGVVQFGDEHGGHAVERGGALAVHRLQRGERVELGGRQDQRGAGDHATPWSRSPSRSSGRAARARRCDPARWRAGRAKSPCRC